MDDLTTADYIATLPEIETSRLPNGTLFFAQGHIYQVIETGGSGYHKARQWRKAEGSEVALIPGSFPAKYLPLVQRGHLLPVYRSRLELTENNQATCYVFPTENLALDAAYLDVALIQSAGAYVRNQESDPAFAVTDGIHVFRLYYYRQSQGGRKTNLTSLQGRSRPFRPCAHTEGPGYWRLLPSWIEAVPDLDITQTAKLVNVLPDVPESGTALSNETLPNMPQMRVPADD